MPDAPPLPPPGLSETRFGLVYYEPDLHTLFEVVDLRRKSGELWGELTVRCNLEGVRGQLDGNRLRQGNFNFSSMTTRQSWAKALASQVPDALNKLLDWGNLMEMVCQEVLDHERTGAIHGGEIVGRRAPSGGRPWAAYPILPHGDTATLFARGGAGKTGLVATMAFGMALGRSLIPGIRVDRPYRTAILDWETNQETAEDLWGTIAETNHVAVPKGVWYEPMDQPLERSLPKIANVLDRHKADLVIIDSVMMAMISSAEGAGDPADGITRVYQSLRKLGTWGLLIDHVTGGDMTSRKVAMKAYGSIFKMNLARHAIVLHIGNRVGETSQAYLLCPKSNVGRDRWAMGGTLVRNDDELRWAFSDMDYDLYDGLTAARDGDEPTSQEMPDEEFATPRQADRYINALFDAAPAGLTVNVIQHSVGAPSGAYVRKTMNRLQRDGLVTAVDQIGSREKLWVLTQTGIDFKLARQPE